MNARVSAHIRSLLLIAAVSSLKDDVQADQRRDDDRSRPVPRIVNGEPTFLVPSVGVMNAGNTLCTATLIGCETVLTAAHCVCPAGADDNYRECTHAGVVAPEDVVFFFQHAGFAFARSVVIDDQYETGQGGDLAIVKLREPVSGIAPQPINTERRVRNGTPATIVGFGRTEGFNPVPPGVGLKRIGDVETSSCPDDIRSENNVCSHIESGESTTCNGDSGGPLLVDFGSGPVVAGVAAGVEGGLGILGCLPPFDDIWTDAFRYRSFIVDQAGDDLGVDPCGDLPPVGSPGTAAYTFLGALSDGAREVRDSFEVPPGAQLLRVTMNGVLATDAGRNNFDLYVRAGSPAAAGNSDCADTRDSAFGVCDITAPIVGTWHVLASRVAGNGEVQMTATIFYDPDAPTATASTTATNTPTPTRTPRPTGPVEHCVGDCDADETIRVDELIRGVEMALGLLAPNDCSAFDSDGDGIVRIDDLVRAVDAAMRGCL